MDWTSAVLNLSEAIVRFVIAVPLILAHEMKVNSLLNFYTHFISEFIYVSENTLMRGCKVFVIFITIFYDIW